MNCIRKIISSECSFSQFWNVSKFIEICRKCIGRIIWSNAVLLEMCFDRNCTLSVDNGMSDWGNFCRRTKIDSPAFSILLFTWFKTGKEDRCDKDEILRLPNPPIIPLGRRFPLPLIGGITNHPPRPSSPPNLFTLCPWIPHPQVPHPWPPTHPNPLLTLLTSPKAVWPQTLYSQNILYTFVSCCSICTYVSFDRSPISSHPWRVRRCFYSFSSLLRPPITLITAPLPLYLMISHWSKLSKMKMRMWVWKFEAVFKWRRSAV